MVASSGDRLLEPDAEQVIARRLVPLATLVTPNLDEAQILAEEAVRTPEQMERAGRALLRQGAQVVLVKGGHLEGDTVVDVLVSARGVHRFTHPRIDTTATHGTGCTLSAAIAAGLALGRPLARAVEDGLDFVHAGDRGGARARRGTRSAQSFRPRAAPAARGRVVTRPYLTAIWRDLVLVTFAVPDELAVPLVPPGCDADRWDGRCHMSLVALQMDRVRVRGLPIPGLTTYPQVNLRLYVRHEGRAAVRFVQELVPSRLLAAGARWLYGEPFRAGRIRASLSQAHEGPRAEYRFGLDRPRWHVTVQGAARTELPAAGSFEHWVKERVRGCRTDRAGRLRTFEVTHPPWAVRPVTAVDCRVDFAGLYGPAWAPLDATSPVSVIYAVGSEVTVSAPT